MRSLEDVEEVLTAGAARAVLGTVALEDPTALGHACRRYGEKIAVSLDARGGELASHGWTVGTGVPVLDAVEAFERAGVAMFVYTDVGRDGTLGGPDLQGLLRLKEATSLPVIASGGIGSLDDLRAVARLAPRGVVGAVVGRALYEQRFDLRTAIATAEDPDRQE